MVKAVQVYDNDVGDYVIEEKYGCAPLTEGSGGSYFTVSCSLKITIMSLIGFISWFLVLLKKLAGRSCSVVFFVCVKRKFDDFFCSATLI